MFCAPIRTRTVTHVEKVLKTFVSTNFTIEAFSKRIYFHKPIR